MRRIFLSFLALGSFACASEIVTNSPAWNGTNQVSPWGNDGDSTPTYGQTITVPTDGNNVLSSFTFQIFGAAPSIFYQAYVQQWGSTDPTGTPLYTSSVSATLTSAGASAYTFNPGIALTAGGTYILYFSTIGDADANTNELNWGATDASSYSGGAFWYTNQDSTTPATGSISDLNGAQWFNDGSSVGQLAFSATFNGSSAPEPGSIGLVLAGLGALVWRAKRG